MSFTGLDVFDTTLQKTNSWLNELGELLGSDDRRYAYLALRCTLQALRDRLTVDEAAELGAQLPMLVRGIYYEGWRPTGKPLRIRTKAEFLDRVVRDLRTDDPVDPELLVSAVFEVLARRVTAGEIEDVTLMLPAELQALWPGRTRAA
ncbi:MAG TPA: DUF2267 domain-containing protein [Terriglobales bacterium]|nr:DUF2267 domain-containing protein [Terriglobales bacterium]